MSTIFSLLLLVLSLVSLIVVYFVIFVFCRFLLLEYINPWRADRGKKPYSRRFAMIVSVLFALAFVI